MAQKPGPEDDSIVWHVDLNGGGTSSPWLRPIRRPFDYLSVYISIALTVVFAVAVISSIRSTGTVAVVPTIIGGLAVFASIAYAARELRRAWQFSKAEQSVIDWEATNPDEALRMLAAAEQIAASRRQRPDVNGPQDRE